VKHAGRKEVQEGKGAGGGGEQGDRNREYRKRTQLRNRLMATTRAPRSSGRMREKQEARRMMVVGIDYDEGKVTFR